MRSPLSDRVSAAKSGAGRGVGEAVAVTVAVGVGGAVALGDSEGVTSDFVHAATIAAAVPVRKLRLRTFPGDLVVELAPAEVFHVVRRDGIHRLAEEDAEPARPAIADAVRDERLLQTATAELRAHAAVAQPADRSNVEQHPRRRGLAVDAAEEGASAS